jgi:hypothetical protein
MNLPTKRSPEPTATVPHEFLSLAPAKILISNATGVSCTSSLIQGLYESCVDDCGLDPVIIGDHYGQKSTRQQAAAAAFAPFQQLFHHTS